MRMRERPIERDWNFLKFASLQGGFWAVAAIGAFFTVFMQENGMSVSEIGIVNAVISAICIIAIPMWGMISDRIGSIKKVALVLFAGSCVVYWMIPFAWDIKLGLLPLAIILGCVAFFFRNPAASIVDNWTVRGTIENGLNYGPVRAIGSIGYAIAGFIIAAVIPKAGVNWSFYLSSLFFLPLMWVAVKTPDGVRNKPQSGGERPKLSSLFKNYYYIAYIVFYIGCNLALSCNFVFMPFLVNSRGVPMSNVGFVTGFSALAEVPMLMMARFLRRRFPPYKLIITAVVFFVAESVLHSYTVEFWQIIAVRALFGIGNGLFIAGNANHIYSLAPEGLKATAQTVVAAAGSVAGILGNFFGGFIIESTGISNFYLMLGIIFIVMGSVFVASFIFGNKVLKLSKPGLV